MNRDGLILMVFPHVSPQSRAPNHLISNSRQISLNHSFLVHRTIEQIWELDSQQPAAYPAIEPKKNPLTHSNMISDVLHEKLFFTHRIPLQIADNLYESSWTSHPSLENPYFPPIIVSIDPPSESSPSFQSHLPNKA